MEVKDENYTLYPKEGCGRGFKEESGFQDQKKWVDIDGVVETTHGFVLARSHSFGKYRNSSLEIIKNGRKYYRWINKKQYSARGLVTKAKQFANEVFAE